LRYAGFRELSPGGDVKSYAAADGDILRRAAKRYLDVFIFDVYGMKKPPFQKNEGFSGSRGTVHLV